MTIRKNLRDPESRAFWESVAKTDEEVRKWPAWMQGDSDRVRLGEKYAAESSEEPESPVKKGK
jgi:hypothetical protein